LMPRSDRIFLSASVMGASLHTGSVLPMDCQKIVSRSK
jgi:hypothetical protein